jgi:DNA gyrase subunit A
MQDEDLIPVEDVVIAMTLNGYIKRTTIDTFHVQNRGGKGVKGMATHSDDIVDQFITMSTHDYLLLFTNFGKVYRIKGYRVPQASRIAKGIPVVNLLNLDKDEKVKAMSAVSTDSDNAFFVFSTKEGLVKRVAVSEFESIRQSGKIAISLRDGDELIAVKQTTGDDEIIIAGANGKAVRFNENDVRPMGRNAAGVRGFNVDGSEVIGMTTDKEGEYILAVTQGGYGKKSALEDYRLTNRGAKGVKTINITEKNGPLVSMRAVTGNEELLIVTDEGTVIRISLKNVGTYGRNTQGVKLIQLGEGHSVSSVAVIPVEEIEENQEENTVKA